MTPRSPGSGNHLNIRPLPAQGPCARAGGGFRPTCYVLRSCAAAGVVDARGRAQNGRCRLSVGAVGVLLRSTNRGSALESAPAAMRTSAAQRLMGALMVSWLLPVSRPSARRAAPLTRRQARAARRRPGVLAGALWSVGDRGSSAGDRSFAGYEPTVPGQHRRRSHRERLRSAVPGDQPMQRGQPCPIQRLVPHAWDVASQQRIHMAQNQQLSVFGQITRRNRTTSRPSTAGRSRKRG